MLARRQWYRYALAVETVRVSEYRGARRTCHQSDTILMTSCALQVRSHAQKWFIRMQKKGALTTVPRDLPEPIEPRCSDQSAQCNLMRRTANRTDMRELRRAFTLLHGLPPPSADMPRMSVVIDVPTNRRDEHCQAWDMVAPRRTLCHPATGSPPISPPLPPPTSRIPPC